MPLSNSTNYTIDRDTLIRSAYELIHVAVEGQAMQANEITVASRTLNMMLKAWTAFGLHIWKRKRHIINPLVLNQSQYLLGTPLATRVTLAGAGTTATATIVQHNLSTGESITIAGATDVDYNGTFTITVTDENTFTYTAGGAVGATDAGTAVLASAGSIIRPERLSEVTRVDTSGNSVPMTELTRNEYEQLPTKTSAGIPIQFHYERTLGAGIFYVWPTADATAVTEYKLHIDYQAPIDDMNASNDSFDFPQEWYEAITLGLAERLGPRYGLPIDELRILKGDAFTALTLAKDYDVEEGSVYLQADLPPPAGQ